MADTAASTEFIPHGAKCICQICCCSSKHKCPIKAKPSEARFRGESTVSVDYQPWPVQTRYRKERQHYQPSAAPLDNLTTARRDYIVHEGFVAAVSAKPERVTGNNDAKFRGTTEVRDEYQSWPVPPRPVPRKRDYVPNNSEFYGSTVCQETYRGLPAEPVQSAKPIRKVTDNNAKFRGQTEFNSSYQTWDVPPRAIKEKKQWTPSEGEFYGVTENVSQYQGHQTERVTAFKPKQSTSDSHAKFRGESVMHTDYQTWDCPEPVWRKEKPSYEPSPAKFDDRTTMANSYTEKEIPVCPSVVLLGQQPPQDAPTTRSGETYQFIAQPGQSGHQFYHVSAAL